MASENQFLNSPYYGISWEPINITFWVSAAAGLGILIDPLTFRKSAIKSVLGILCYDENNTLPPEFDLSEQENTVAITVPRGPAILDDLNAYILVACGIEAATLKARTVLQRRSIYQNEINSNRLLISKKIINDLEQYKKFSELRRIELLKFLNQRVEIVGSQYQIYGIPEGEIKGIQTDITVEWENQNWLLIKIGDCPDPKFDFKKFARENPESDYAKWPCLLAEWYFQESAEAYRPSAFSKIWEDIIQTPFIPYDLVEREKKLSHAYIELGPYIESYKRTKQLLAEELHRYLEGLDS
jgi:hypothetical protein